MKHGLTLGAFFLAMAASGAFAGDGVLSQAQLQKLGLQGLQLVDDQQGSQIRGKHFLLINFALTAVADSVTATPVSNSLTFGQKLTFQPPNVGPQVFGDTVVALDPVTGTLAASDFLLVVGNAGDVAPFLGLGGLLPLPPLPAFP